MDPWNFLLAFDITKDYFHNSVGKQKWSRQKTGLSPNTVSIFMFVYLTIKASPFSICFEMVDKLVCGKQLPSKTKFTLLQWVHKGYKAKDNFVIDIIKAKV